MPTGTEHTHVPDATANDWQLKPRQHIAQLGPNGAPLAQILSRSTFEELIDAFETSDAAAVRARNWYKSLAGLAAFFSLIAVLLAAILLLLSARSLNELGIDRTWLAVAQGASLLASFVLSLANAAWRPFDRWMGARATAEFNRILYFNRIIEARPDDPAAETTLLPLKLDYFTRYQLDVQRRYYAGRGRQHARAVWRANALRILALLLVGLSAIPIISAFAGHDTTTWLTALGLGDWATDHDLQQRVFIAASTSGAALQGWLAATALIDQDERNSVRYRATAQNLETLAGRPLDEARAAASKGDESDVRAFVALVQEQISSEHREWVDLRTVAPSQSLVRLKGLALPPDR